MLTRLPPPVVRINNSLITGTTQPANASYPRAVDLFHSIPYASLARFERAVPLEPCTDLDASRPGKPQPTFMAPDPDAEGRLTLTVVRPSGCAGGGGGEEGARRLLPVVVYVHGGGFNFGEPLERNLASFVAHGERDVVVVAVSYRLGVLGFLAGGEGEERGELNLGLRDQKVAVEWVRRWIGAFGGDGEDITLMGVSAGAHSIGHHILHPDRLPFRKAILESGSATARSVLSPAHPRTKAQYQDVTSRAGAPLKTMPIGPLLEAAIMVWADNQAAVTWPFQPVVDTTASDSMIPNTPLQLWDDFTKGSSGSGSGSHKKHISIITGFCSHEGTSFVPNQASTNAEFRSFFATLIPSFTPSDLDALEALYPDPVTHPDSPYRNEPRHRSRYGAQFRRLHEAYAHYAYICPILHTAHMLSSAATSASEDTQVHVYVYEYAALGAAFAAASHGEQAPVVAHDMEFLRGRPGLIATAREMNRRWTAFAAAEGGVLGEDVWPEFTTPFDDAATGGEGKLLVFGEGNDEEVDDGAGNPGVPVRERTLTEGERERCRFWWARMGLSEGMCER